MRLLHEGWLQQQCCSTLGAPEQVRLCSTVCCLKLMLLALSEANILSLCRRHVQC